MAGIALSRGQQQLLSLATAMLRKKDSGGLLVLDEATGSVDAETDALMQRLLREECRTYTVVAVAHRLETIVDADAIVVMEEGAVMEFDAPGRLLERRSRFRALWDAQH
ncbi:hypothetical protein MMC27_002933 [Xylographa pallens]|nr:hypothetical protein [Xylographa pallens]